MIDIGETIYRNRMTQASLGRLINKKRAQIWRWAHDKSGIAPHNEEMIRKVFAEHGLIVVEKSIDTK
tara:strand:- start:8235 stop:8435 length:201 start_codon:yes stop_codon:yes gene_type:complete